MPPTRPQAVPSDAVFNPDENEWEIGERNADGAPVGPWVWWHPTGEKACEASYDDQGRLHGRLVRWHRNGERSQWAPWMHGKTHGVQVWTRPTTGEADPSSVLPPNLPDRVVRMDMPYEHGVAQPDCFTLYLEAGRDDGVPYDDQGHSIDLAAHLHKVDEDTVLLPVEASFLDIDGNEVASDPADGRWIYRGPAEGGFHVRHRQGRDKTDHLLSAEAISGAFTLAADGYLAWRTRSRPEGVPVGARYDDGTDTWSHGPEHDGRPHGRWTSWRPDGSVRAHLTYVHGSLTGPFERFHPDGSRSRRGTHEAGSEVGTSTWWRTDEPTDEDFPSESPAIRRAEHDHGTHTTTWFLTDDQPCNRYGIALPEAWHDDWFEGDPAGFLDEGFVAYLDAFCPKDGDGPRAELLAQLENLWGHPPADDVVDVLMHCLERGGPRLVEWQFQIDVLAQMPEGEFNTFEHLLHSAQRNYLSSDLIELFGGCVWVGALGNGDGWLVSLFEAHNEPSCPGQVYLFDHEEVWISPAVAPSLSHLALLTTVQDAWRDTESISPDALRRSVHQLDGLVAPPWHFRDLLEEAELELTPYEPEGESTRYLATTSAWIIALLRNDGIADVGDDFIESMFPSLDEQPWPDRVARAAQHVPIGLYWLWRLFFFGDDRRLADMMDACEESPARLLRDAARLLRRIVEGDKQVGSIEDIYALREAFLALDLDPARAEERAAAAEAAQVAAEAHRATVRASVKALDIEQLRAQAWAHVHDADWIAAAMERWTDGGIASACLAALQASPRTDSPGAWGLTERIRQADDPMVAAIATSWVLTDHQAHIGRHLLAALAPAEAVDPLRPLLDEEERYRHNQTLVVQLIGQRRRVDQVPVLIAALEVDVEGLNRIHNGDYVTAAIRALGRIGTPEAVDALRAAVGRHDVASVASALADAGAVEAVAELAPLLEDHAHPELLWALAELAGSAPPDVQAEIAAAARRLEDKGLASMTVRAHLLRRLGQEVDDLRRWVRTSLAPEMASYSEKPSIAQKVWALRVAAEHDDVEDEVLLRWVVDDHPDLREAARAAARRRGLSVPDLKVMDRVSVRALDDDALLDAITDSAVVLRHVAIQQLAQRGRTDAGPQLLQVLDDFLERWHPLWSGQDTPETLRAVFRNLRANEAPELLDACERCLADERKQVNDPVLREPVPPHPPLLPFMVRIARDDTGWRQRAAKEWLDGFPDADAVAAAGD